MSLLSADVPPLPTPVPLWNGPAPLSHGQAATDIPTLTPFPLAHPTTPGPAVVICPGGGYEFLSMEFEGYNEARWFNAHGVAAFVLTYRLPSHGYPHPVPLMDAQRALRVVRSRAKEWHIAPDKVGVMGFSAGGHLASTLETHYDRGKAEAADPVDRLSCRPDFCVLVYAVISMENAITPGGSKAGLLGPNPDPKLVENLSNDKQVTPQTPPTLLIAVDDDTTVPVENSRRMFAALKKAGVTTAFQEYPRGGHGFGMGHVPDPGPPGWLDRMGDWLRSQGFMP
jgi:acetyl esterase/lipase